MKRTRFLAPVTPRSRTRTRATGTGLIPIWIVRSGPWPCRTRRARPSGSCRSCISPQVEVYSIDESFLDLTDVALARRVEPTLDLRGTVWACIGSSTCVGIGPTRMVIKLANHIAKRIPEFAGACDPTNPETSHDWLIRISDGEAWGVGCASLAKLEAIGVESVADLLGFDPRPAGKSLTVMGERIILELSDLACLPLEQVPARCKGCLDTGSVGPPSAHTETSGSSHAEFASYLLPDIILQEAERQKKEAQRALTPCYATKN